MKVFDKTFAKFLVVGVINTIVGSGVMFLLYNFAKASYWVSSACNYIVGGLVRFFLNKHFTFQNKEKSFCQFLLFAINVTVCYFLAYGISKKLIFLVLQKKDTTLKDNIALVGGMFLYTALNYFSQRFIVFKSEKENKNE